MISPDQRDSPPPEGAPTVMLLLFRFRYKNQFGKWVTARYRAEHKFIKQQYDEFELLGDPEVREPHRGSFNPFRKEEEPAE